MVFFNKFFNLYMISSYLGTILKLFCEQTTLLTLIMTILFSHGDMEVALVERQFKITEKDLSK